MSVESITGTITHSNGTITKFEMSTNNYDEVIYSQDAGTQETKRESLEVLDAITEATGEFFEPDAPTVEFRSSLYSLGEGHPVEGKLTIENVAVSAWYQAERGGGHGWEDHTAEVYAIDRQSGGTLSVKFTEDQAGTINGWHFTESDAEGMTANIGTMNFGPDDAETYLESLAEQITTWIDGGEIG